MVGSMSGRAKRVGVLLILLFAFAGLADSAYLAEHESAGAPLICDIAHFSGCNVVAESPYSKVFGIPVAEYGILFYAIVFATCMLELILFDRILRKSIQWLAVFGVLASLYFVFVQVFIIEALCIYCLASAALSLAIGGVAGLLEPIRRPGSSPRKPLLAIPPL